MNIETTAPVKQTLNSTNSKNINSQKKDDDFSKELDSLSAKTEQTAKDEKISDKADEKIDEKVDEKLDKKIDEMPEVKSDETVDEKLSKKTDEKVDKKTLNNKDKTENIDKNININQDEKLEDVFNGLENIVEKMSMVNRTDEKTTKTVKEFLISDDNNGKKEDSSLIDNNMNIQEPKQQLNPQMNANMNFNSNGQPFAEFVNPQKNEQLKSSEKDLAEEKEILSTMDENIAIANRNMALAKTKTVTNEHGIKKVDKQTNIIVDTIVSYDNVIMDKTDVDFFVNLVENGEVDLNNVQQAEKVSKVSKTLADLIAKSMNENKPIRIDFDNNISVIIKINKEGKINADFLPSSQIAEAYLKENLPLLKQRFDDNNINYGELNQRKQQKQDQDNRKKGRKDE